MFDEKFASAPDEDLLINMGADSNGEIGEPSDSGVKRNIEAASPHKKDDGRGIDGGEPKKHQKRHDWIMMYNALVRFGRNMDTVMFLCDIKG